MLLLLATTTALSFDGPLRVSAKNPRYFTDGSGRAILLVGSHTWENFQDVLPEGAQPFDYPGYLGMMAANRHNFMRFWTWEQTAMGPWSQETIRMAPMPYLRTGPGLALDGEPKFDLTKFNPEFFARMRERIVAAGEKGIYASVMLFQGWCLPRSAVAKPGNPFPYLPFNAANNINGVAAPETTDDFDDQATLHSLKSSRELQAVQEAYVRKVVETVNDLDNVLYEVINEGGSLEWQYHIIRFVKQVEAGLPKQHPVGMTHRWFPAHTNQVLFDSPADWISPNEDKESKEADADGVRISYMTNPPAANGAKVVVTDTDHLWGHGGNSKWIWKSFLRGMNVLFMDPWRSLPGRKDEASVTPWLYDWGGISKDQRDYPEWTLLRAQLGQVRAYADRINLVGMAPHGELSSTHYCLAEPGREYLIYFPESGEGKIDLRGQTGEFSVEWFIPLLNQTVAGPRPVSGGDFVKLTPPISLDAVLYLKRR